MIHEADHAALPPQGLMAQCRFALRPDGLFLAAMLGGDTLQVGAGGWH